jgi:hypothetical protein
MEQRFLDSSLFFVNFAVNRGGPPHTSPCRYRSIAVANFIGTSYKEYLDCEDLRCLQHESPDELIHVQDTLMAV